MIVVSVTVVSLLLLSLLLALVGLCLLSAWIDIERFVFGVAGLSLVSGVVTEGSIVP